MAIEYKRRDITVDEYHRMDAAGIFRPDERVANTSAAFDRGRKMRMYGQERIREYLLVDVKHNRLTLFGAANDVGYAGSRELDYGDSIAFAATPDLTMRADQFLDRRSA